MGNFEFPILLYESEDIDRSAGGERDAVNGSTCACCLVCRDYMSSSKVHCAGGRTWITTFPGTSITSWTFD